MSSDITSASEFEIPRHGNAGVAFLGVELADAWLVIASVFAGLALGTHFGPVAYLGIPVGGFMLNKWYVDLRSRALPGQVRAALYRAGLVGYSKAFEAADTVYIGDWTVINPASSELVDAHMSRLLSAHAESGLQNLREV